MKKTSLLIVASLAAAAALHGQTFNAVDDTYLRGTDDSNRGGASQFLVGSHLTLSGFTTLLRFDLTSLDLTGLQVDDVTLNLTADGAGSGTSVSLSVFELAAANSDWVAGTGDGLPVSGAASWVWKAHPTGPGSEEAWAGSQGARTAGTDYINTELASYSADATALSSGNTMAFTGETAFNTVVGSSAGGILNLWVGTATLTGANDFFRIQNGGSSLIVTTSPVPEPSAYALIAGMFGLTWVMVRRRRLS